SSLVIGGPRSICYCRRNGGSSGRSGSILATGLLATLRRRFFATLRHRSSLQGTWRVNVEVSSGQKTAVGFAEGDGGAGREARKGRHGPCSRHEPCRTESGTNRRVARSTTEDPSWWWSSVHPLFNTSKPYPGATLERARTSRRRWSGAECPATR